MAEISKPSDMMAEMMSPPLPAWMTWGLMRHRVQLERAALFRFFAVALGPKKMSTGPRPGKVRRPLMEERASVPPELSPTMWRSTTGYALRAVTMERYSDWPRRWLKKSDTS